MMSVVEPTVKQSEQGAESSRICWLEMKRCPYQLDHQVELMHLQAEADALLIKLQAQKAIAQKALPEKDLDKALEQSQNG